MIGPQFPNRFLVGGRALYAGLFLFSQALLCVQFAHNDLRGPNWLFYCQPSCQPSYSSFRFLPFMSTMNAFSSGSSLRHLIWMHQVAQTSATIRSSAPYGVEILGKLEFRLEINLNAPRAIALEAVVHTEVLAPYAS